jgi:hypothetical protein
MRIQNTKLLVRLLPLLVLIIALAIPPSAAAQSVPDAPRERFLQRAAPVRQPVVRSTRVTPSGVNTVIEIPPIADTYIASERPSQNFGGDALFLGYNRTGDGFGAQRILIRFNLNSIPSNATINSARLRLRLSFSSPENDEPMGTVLRRLASSWDEFDVTWNREPEWASVRESTAVGSALQWYEWEISDLVSGWVDGRFDNHGMEIIGDERVQQRERVFYSRETTTDFAPQLIVDFDVIDDTQPPDVEVQPLPDFVGRDFTVRWEGNDPGSADIDFYDVQYRVDGGEWQTWLSEVTTTVDEFTMGENGRFYQFRARGVDEAGNVEPFGGPEASTTVDTEPPTARVEPLPAFVQSEELLVSWTGDDSGGSGIQYYDVRYRVDGGPWLPWQQQTTATSAIFITGRDGLYEFEARAVDNLGQVEPFTGEPQAFVRVDARAPFVEPEVWLPLILSGNVAASR